jgi:hypothetical protein
MGMEHKEALSFVISGELDSAWKVQILDLKPAMQTDETHGSLSTQAALDSPLLCE